MDGDARRTVERAARDSRARLLAYLSARTRDLPGAEDALADAFRTALETWPRDGIPARPEAWLLTAARRRLIDGARRARVRGDAAAAMMALSEEAYEVADDAPAFPDDRLKLMFVCAHPAIDPAARAPLMLQTVLGLDAARIASAFLVKPSAMGQRLARAKAKIRDAGIAFAIPGPADLPGRLDAVLDAIYAAYGSGWDDIAGADPRRRGLAEEALDLGRLAAGLLPHAAEAQGLLALMLLCEARRPARRGHGGAYVPLAAQDTALWDKRMIAEAESVLAHAEQLYAVGRFQLEAAIQLVHARRAVVGATDWEAIALLYEGLLRIAPSIGAGVSRAAALAEAGGAALGWAALEVLAEEDVAAYQPYWAVAAHLLARLGRRAEAARAYARAMGLCEDPAMRAFLAAEAARL
ncbi:MAG: RNA polymerase subunit sigma-70 [Proteobacteria bacterium]|nr:RNA polymerase subunit sigma-70 [Pseudomonadota bacterium]